MAERDFELVLVGGGLQNGLIAIGALHAGPHRRIALVEADATLGGNHTWCVHPHDVPVRARDWVDALLVHRWQSYEVRFPSLHRTVPAPYAAITSSRFGEAALRAVQQSPSSAVYLGCRATRVAAHAVELDDGTTLGAELVVDARGPERAAYADVSGFQKFVGVELELGRAHGLQRPILMDATVEQRDGFRFMYTLPPALALAQHMSERPAHAVFDGHLARLYRRHRAQVRFAQHLNRLLFHCFEPRDMWNVFARFYTLPDDVIHRFYSMSLTALDRARLLAGRPPRGFSLARAWAGVRTYGVV